MANYMTAGYQHYIAGEGGGPLKPEHVSGAAWGATAINRFKPGQRAHIYNGSENGAIAHVDRIK